MAEYEALIQNLRSIDEYDTGYAKLIYDAADAIEELQERVAASEAIIKRQSDIIQAKDRDLQRAIDAKPSKEE